jgi:cell division protein FtsQ
MTRPAAARPVGTRGVASSRQRFQARAAEARRRPWRLASWGAGTVAVAAALVWLVGFSPVLVVRTVEVVGVSPAQAATVSRMAAVPLGVPLARVDEEVVVDRVIQLATLADVSMERSWPSTIVIHASPRVPVLVAKNPQGRLHVVDAEGVAYAQVRRAPPGVPVVNAASDGALSREALLAALSVVQVLPAPLQRRVTGVTVSGANLVTFTLDRTTVVWGGVAQPERKLAVMSALLRMKPKVIDVSAPQTPVTR